MSDLIIPEPLRAKAKELSLPDSLAAECTDPMLQRLPHAGSSRHASALELLVSERESMRAENDSLGKQLGDLRRVYAACRSDLDASREKIRRQSEALADQQAYQDFRAKWETHCDLDATPPLGDGVKTRGQGREEDDPIGGMRLVTLCVFAFGIAAVVILKLAGWL